MTMIVRTAGALMLAYSALYTAHYVFDTLYDAQPVWTVFNIVSAAGIVIALAANVANVRAGSGPDVVSRLGAYVLVYANAALAIWFFRNWVDLLALEEGESVSVHSDVVWMVIAVLIPLVLGHHGMAPLAAIWLNGLSGAETRRRCHVLAEWASAVGVAEPPAVELGC